MMSILIEQVERLADEEYQLAAEQHGAVNHSAHESYAVLLEELEEAGSAGELAKKAMGAMWENVKRDGEITTDADWIEKNALWAAAEYIQVAAMARKARETEAGK
jgi:hypothetical protein